MPSLASWARVLPWPEMRRFVRDVIMKGEAIGHVKGGRYARDVARGKQSTGEMVGDTMEDGVW